MMPRRIVVKLKPPRELHKSLKPRWATKARTPRIPVNIGFSSSDNQKVLMGSEASVGLDSEKVIIGFADDDDDSGNLKRKFKQIEDINPSGRGDHCKIQKTDSGVVSEGDIRESEKKIDQTSSREECSTDDDHQAAEMKNLQVVSEKVIMIGFADDDFGSLKRCKYDETQSIGSGHHKIQETADSWVVSPKISDQINTIDHEISLSAAKTSSGEGCTCTDDGQTADIKNLHVVSSASVNENNAPMAHKTPKRYACSLCSKTFSSHQALGGHKSSHYKFTMKIYDAIDVHRPKKQLLISNTTTTCHQQIGDDRTHYTCKICFKKFPSSQALGGHQRRHWNGNMKTQSARKMLDFDLNELPKEEDEDPSAKC